MRAPSSPTSSATSARRCRICPTSGSSMSASIRPRHPPAVRLRVFLLANQAAVQRMAGSDSVVGYYVSEARGLMLVGTRHRETGGLNDIRTAHQDVEIDPENVLFHEYTHHFTFEYFP